MPTRRFKSPLHRLLFKLGHEPMELVGLVPPLLLGWVLWLSLKGFGGFVDFALPGVGVLKAILLLGLVHAVVVMARKRHTGLTWEALLPLPFLLLALLHDLFLSPAGWSAAISLLNMSMAYIVYLVVLSNIRGRLSLQWMLGACAVVVVAAMLLGFRQFYMSPGGMMEFGRIRNPEYAHGIAGLLQDPQILSSLLLLFWPLAVTVSWMRRFSEPVRIASGFTAVIMPIGIILSANSWGILIFAGLVFVMPFFLAADAWVWRRFWAISAMSTALFVLFGWFATEGLRDRFLYLWDSFMSLGQVEGLATAIQTFLQSPLAGHGLGSFWLAIDLNSTNWNAEALTYPGSSIVGMLAETGLVGVSLAILPVIFIVIGSVKAWRQLPHVTYDPDIIRRLQFLPGKVRSRNKMARAQSRSSSSKVLMGGLLPGLVAFLLYQLQDYSLLFPFHMLVLAVVLACLVHLGREYELKSVKPATGRFIAVLPLLLAGACYFIAIPRFDAQHLVFTASEKLDMMEKQPGLIFEQPELLEAVEMDLQSAVESWPRHALGWRRLGEARLAFQFADEIDPESIALAAKPSLEQALQRCPLDWRAHFAYARVLLMSSGDPSEAMPYLEEASERAPLRPEPKALLGMLHLLSDPKSETGVKLAGEALTIHPEYTELLEFMAWLKLTQSGKALDGTLVTPSMIAEQIRPLPRTAGGPFGAGLARRIK